MHMKWIKNMAAMTAFASLTSGCAMYELEELRHTTPSGSPFQKELAKLYMDFAGEDEKGYDWFNSWYFADKGLRAAYGKDVAPEDPKDWDIPADALPYLERAHEELLAALTPATEQMHPTAAAQAQFYFDCWVQRQEENWQSERIVFCREGFSHALDDIGLPPIKQPSEGKTAKSSKHHKADAGAEQKTAAVELKGEKADKADVAETMSYVVFFAGERPVITEPGEQVLDDVIKSLKGGSDYQIVLKSGAGSDPKSQLFNQRAEAVSERLIEGGVKADAIRTASSEGSPTARRVEIFLSQ